MEGSAAKRRWIVYQDVAARQAEQNLREARHREVELQFQSDLRRMVDMSALSQDQIEAVLRDQDRHEQELQARKLSAEERRALDASPEEKQRIQRSSIAMQLWSPVSRSAARLLGGLSAEQWEMLRRDGQLIFSTDPLPGELPLPREETSRLRAAQPRSDIPPLRPSSLEEQENRRSYEQRRQEEWAAATGYRVLIQFDAGQLEQRDQLGLRADVMAIRSGDSPPFRRYSHGSDNPVGCAAGS
jgi:hypothetical protein